MKFVINRNKLTLVSVLVVSILSFSSVAKSNFTAKELERFSLGPQVNAMIGYDIRARRIIVEPGAKITQHEHSKTPGIVYVESGTIVEYRGQQSRQLIAGETLIEDANTVHSYQNTSDKPCVLIAIDLPHNL